MTHFEKRSSVRRGFLFPLVFLPVVLGLASCETTVKDPESAAVRQLTQQGFKLVSDGRNSEAPSAMQYSGAPASVIQCSTNGGDFSAPPALKTSVTSGGLSGRETAQVDGYVIVGNDGGKSGIYIDTVTREIRSKSGKLLAREIEIIEFYPGQTGQFKNGTTCKARG